MFLRGVWQTNLGQDLYMLMKEQRPSIQGILSKGQTENLRSESFTVCLSISAQTTIVVHSSTSRMRLLKYALNKSRSSSATWAYDMQITKSVLKSPWQNMFVLKKESSEKEILCTARENLQMGLKFASCLRKVVTTNFHRQLQESLELSSLKRNTMEHTGRYLQTQALSGFFVCLLLGILWLVGCWFYVFFQTLSRFQMFQKREQPML